MSPELPALPVAAGQNARSQHPPSSTKAPGSTQPITVLDQALAQTLARSRMARLPVAIAVRQTPNRPVLVVLEVLRVRTRVHLPRARAAAATVAGTLMAGRVTRMAPAATPTRATSRHARRHPASEPSFSNRLR